MKIYKAVDPILHLRPFISLITSVVITVIMVDEVIFNKNFNIIGLYIVVVTILYFSGGMPMYYFLIDDDINQITVRNIWYFWVKKTYFVSDISKIEISSAMRAGVSLVVFTSKGKKKSYPCSSIRNSDIIGLISDLRGKGLIVDCKYKL